MNRATKVDEPMAKKKHNGMDHQASPEEIERDLARTRADLNDTLSAIEHRLSPGELVDQLLDYLRGGPKDFAVNLGGQARDNPMPVALMAISLGWLMYGSRAPSRRYPEEYGEYTSEGIAEKGYGKAGEGYEKAAESMEEARERVSSKAAELRERFGQKLSEKKEAMAEKREEMREKRRHRAQAMASGVRRGGGEMASGIRHTGEKARGTYSYLLNEQPLWLGALGIALGAFLGAGLPTTARERETFGPTRDEAVSRAREMGREQMDKSREELKQAVSESSTVHSGTPPH